MSTYLDTAYSISNQLISMSAMAHMVSTVPAGILSMGMAYKVAQLLEDVRYISLAGGAVVAAVTGLDKQRSVYDCSNKPPDDLLCSTLTTLTIVTITFGCACLVAIAAKATWSIINQKPDCSQRMSNQINNSSNSKLL